LMIVTKDSAVSRVDMRLDMRGADAPCGALRQWVPAPDGWVTGLRDSGAHDQNTTSSGEDLRCAAKMPAGLVRMVPKILGVDL
jgi:hypothetical protein